MKSFKPSQVFFEPQALDYQLGRDLVDHFRQIEVPIKATTSHNRLTGIAGNTASESYFEAKRTLVIGVRRGKIFQTCKPSAHYQLPLATSCPGMCEYCYLATTLGQKPYVRVYVNVDEILEIAQDMIKLRSPEITIFEGAATSDPLPVERYTGNLKKTIQFFGEQPYGRFRFVTKFTEVESLLDAKHNGHTRFRFSLNCEEVIRNYEHGTPSAKERIVAASEVLKAGYPLGFIIAPLFRFENWEDQYTKLFILLAEHLTQNSPVNWSSEQLSFEFITHRFTPKAKSNILKVFPQNKLPMDEAIRKYKFGQFGYGKYVYRPEEMDELKAFFLRLTANYFPGAGIEYFI
ncbi:MAG TPA: spore photoproduct lyase [Candidatus Deferrimicrobium sp.]|nr:spore photoproduct lyase [Candidatus Deferrimicrobium sp.]